MLLKYVCCYWFSAPSLSRNKNGEWLSLIRQLISISCWYRIQMLHFNAIDHFAAFKGAVRKHHSVLSHLRTITAILNPAYALREIGMLTSGIKVIKFCYYLQFTLKCITYLNKLHSPVGGRLLTCEIMTRNWFWHSCQKPSVTNN